MAMSNIDCVVRITMRPNTSGSRYGVGLGDRVFYVTDSQQHTEHRASGELRHVLNRRRDGLTATLMTDWMQSPLWWPR